jgi:ribosomal protein S18 acetylase RimI-like enzyme
MTDLSPDCFPVPATTDRPALARALQERAARARPAERLEVRDGWWLRATTGTSWWLGTVLPHSEPGVGDKELLRRVLDAEQFAARHGTPAGFQVCPGTAPAGLDDLLAGRGYRRHCFMSLQIAESAEVRSHAAADGLRLRREDRPTPDWFAAWQSVSGSQDRQALAQDWAVLTHTELPAAYVSVLLDERVVAVGRAVADSGWAGVFGMATLPEARGRGAAHAVLAALACWAADEQSADRMYLQVATDNDPALRLYARAGFSELAAYHYRSAAPSAATR